MPATASAISSRPLPPPCPGDFGLAYWALEGLFLQLFPDGNARRHVGLTRISRVPDRPLAWYLWTAGTAAAYGLDLEPHDPDGARADLAMRCFPPSGERAGARFSEAERVARASPLFDATGTPRHGRHPSLEPGLFHVALLTLDWSARHGRMTWTLSAPNRWIERDRESGSTLRDVPAWDLAWPLFTRLVTGFAYVHRTAPARVGTAVAAGGVIVRAEADMRVEEGPEEEGGAAEMRRVSVAFDLAGHDPGAGAPFAEPPWRPTADLAAEPPAPLPWIDPAWWRAAAWTFPADRHVCHHCFEEEHHHA